MEDLISIIAQSIPYFEQEHRFDPVQAVAAVLKFSFSFHAKLWLSSF